MAHASDNELAPSMCRGLLPPRLELPPEPLLAAGLSQNGTSQNGTLDLSRAIHARRALEQALDHGTALLAALGLPHLVEPGFVQVDGDALGDALEVVVAHLDAIDPDPDLEPEDELLEAGGDDELDLGWSALHSQVNLGPNSADGDLTALETHGRGFRRSGADDAEDGADAEETYDDPWWSRGEPIITGGHVHG